MSLVKFYKVTALPSTLENNAIYFVQNEGFAETYLTDNSGAAKSVGNSAMITDIAQDLIGDAVESLMDLKFAADIAARDVIFSETEKNVMVLVADAATDPTVDHGAAMYAFNFNGYDADESPEKEMADYIIKIAEYESLDLEITWSAITGKPNSTPGQIDQAVTDSHTHENEAFLDKLGQNANGEITISGAEAKVDWSKINNAPESTTAEIDQSVEDSHVHENHDVLDELTEDAQSGLLLYKDEPIGMVWSEASW